LNQGDWDATTSSTTPWVCTLALAGSLESGLQRLLSGEQRFERTRGFPSLVEATLEVVCLGEGCRITREARIDRIAREALLDERESALRISYHREEEGSPEQLPRATGRLRHKGEDRRRTGQVRTAQDLQWQRAERRRIPLRPCGLQVAERGESDCPLGKLPARAFRESTRRRRDFVHVGREMLGEEHAEKVAW
jgi:hypothetical protein